MRLVRYSYPSYRTLAGSFRSPWSGLDQAIDSLLTDWDSSATRSIPVDVREDKDNLQVTAELPGVAREDVNLEIADDVLSLTATRKVAGVQAQAEAGAPAAEQTVAFARSFSLPYAVQADKVTAELKDGVLRLTLPKAEALKPRKIEVK